MNEDELEYILRQVLQGRESDINAFAKQLEEDYKVSDDELDEIMSRSNKLTPNDVLTLLRFAGRDFEYMHDKNPDNNKYMQYIRDALQCNRIQRMMKELQK